MFGSIDYIYMFDVNTIYMNLILVWNECYD